MRCRVVCKPPLGRATAACTANLALNPTTQRRPRLAPRATSVLRAPLGAPVATPCPRSAGVCPAWVSSRSWGLTPTSSVPQRFMLQVPLCLLHGAHVPPPAPLVEPGAQLILPNKAPGAGTMGMGSLLHALALLGSAGGAPLTAGPALCIAGSAHPAAQLPGAAPPQLLPWCVAGQQRKKRKGTVQFHAPAWEHTW